MFTSDFPWRVAADFGTRYRLLDSNNLELEAPVPKAPVERPAVGDFVALDAQSERIATVRPRASWIARARGNGEAQIVAANVTTAFIVTSPEPREFSPNRVRRYAIALSAGNVAPVVLLNKCETASDLGALVARLRGTVDGATVLPVSALDGFNCDALAEFTRAGATIALCGSSGVGKSTLLNRLCGAETMPTQAMREDGRGRHTTTYRRLVPLPGGVALIDTPGMRAFVPFASEGHVDGAFAQIEALRGRCRFGDCRHEDEPGCAVREGVDPRIIEEWRGLRREQAWLDSRTDVLAAQERKRAWKRIHVANRARDRASEKGRWG